jgi:hypothetical protein
MHLSPVRSELRGPPPFAPAYVSYTHRLQAFIEDLRGCMTVADLAAVTGLSWDTVKNIIKNRLSRAGWKEANTRDGEGNHLLRSVFFLRLS